MSLSIALALGAASMNNLAGTIAPAASGRISPAVYPTAQDYTFLWWPYGWKGVSPDGRKIEALQTGRYGLTFDPEKMDLLTLGPIASPKSYSDAVSESNDAVFALPKAYLSITVRAGGKVYRCVRGALKQDDFENFPIRKLDYGRFVQQTDVLNLEFADEAGEILKATGRFEMVAWSDRLAFIAEVTPESDFPDGLIEIAVNGKAGQSENPAGIWKGGEKRMAFTVWEPDPKIDVKGSDLKVAAEWLPTKPGPPPGPLTVTYDVARGWHQIVLTSDQWGEQQKGQNDRLERASLTLSNPTDRVRALRLFFDRESAVQGTTGVTPILRDTGGNPTGIPVQVSKMWPKSDSARFAQLPPVCARVYAASPSSSERHSTRIDPRLRALGRGRNGVSRPTQPYRVGRESTLGSGGDWQLGRKISATTRRAASAPPRLRMSARSWSG